MVSYDTTNFPGPEANHSGAAARWARPSAEQRTRTPLAMLNPADATISAPVSLLISDLALRLAECGDNLGAAGSEAARVAVELFAETAGIWLIGPDGRTLDPLGSHDIDPVRSQQYARVLSGPRPQVGQGLIGNTAADGSMRLVNEPSLEMSEGFSPYVEFCRRSGVESLLFAPILARGQIIGVLALLRTGSLPPFDRTCEPSVQVFTDSVGHYLEHARGLVSQIRSAALLDSLEPAVVSTDSDRRITTWNRGAELLYGIPSADALGYRLDRLVPTDPQTDPSAPFVPGGSIEDDDRWRVAMNDGEWSGRVRQLAADGRVVDCELRITLLEAPDGRVTGGITLAREFRASNDTGPHVEVGHATQAVIDALDSEIALLDSQGRVTATNMHWEQRCSEGRQQLGAWVDAAPGNDFLALMRSASRIRGTAREALAGIEGVLAGRLHRFTLPYDASSENVERSYRLVVSALPEPGRGAIVKHVDNTLQQGLERQLSHKATHDSLTGLPNRALLHDRLTQALIRAQRTGRLVAVMFVDLDHFKEVNDTLGHAAGDQVLISVSRRLVRACRASDSVTRFGGDEFVLVVEDVDSLDNVRRVAQRVLDSMASPVVVDGTELFFGVSVGVAVAAGDVPAAQQVEGLLRDADTAMYRAKEAGRNTFVLFDPDMRERVASRLALTTALRHAVNRGELRLLYQPQFDCDSDRVVGAEALVRWHQADHGVVSPSEFIEAAEESGVIVEIGAWVLDEACRQAAEWQQKAPNDFIVNVNLSPRQLADPNVVSLVRHTLARHGLDPSRLGLEITESALMDDPEASARTLEELHEIGVRISVDDFGTGYSSLAYLQRFPVDVLKIDRFFISRIPHDDKTAALVRGIVGLADSLGLTTVAEGVETEDQRVAVAELGCRVYQGFLRARPGSADVVTGLLENQDAIRSTDNAWEPRVVPLISGPTTSKGAARHAS
ncbi:MAG: EAL domain-containing protein [Actinomycetes bacterium]